MKERPILILTACFILASSLVVTIYALNSKIVHQSNSFLRTYLKSVAMRSNDLDLQVNSYYFAGKDSTRVYFGNLTAPFFLVGTNPTLTDTQNIHITTPNRANERFYESTRVTILPPFFYLADGLQGKILRGRLGEWNAQRFLKDSAYFTQLVPTGPSTLNIRTRIPNVHENVLAKLQNEPPFFQTNKSLLEKQVDGIFCTDGKLQFNTDLNRLIYLYHYRNEYIVYDTNLRLDYRGHTIDTFSHAQIKVGYVTSENTSVLTSKKTINGQSCTSGNYLFVNSPLLAKNDLDNMLNLQSIIDVYDLRTNTYRFSFTITNYDFKTKLRDFMVIDDHHLLAFFDRYIVTYDLQWKYF